MEKGGRNSSYLICARREDVEGARGGCGVLGLWERDAHAHNSPPHEGCRAGEAGKGEEAG